ncbi:type VII secretion-associated serine protease mycosin [Kitasatospora camelliae]|uniref:Type VII secretion-associated serine protease mycosin n=1 Tax=Kitasatospora camelliae TaxID=3156397 RepID=A0AAU8JTI7_9ACTN
MSSGTFRRAAASFVVLGVVGATAAAPAYAAEPSSGVGAPRWSPISIAAASECTFPSQDVKSTPWALQRVVLTELGADKTGSTGKGVTVAVIDTGVSIENPQLAGAVDNGGSYLNDQFPKDGINDPVGHGTKVAGIIAARKSPNTGFVGLAPDARILSYRQNDAQGSGNVETLVAAIEDAVRRNVGVINISQDVRGGGDIDPDNDPDHAFGGYQKLKAAIAKAEAAEIVVVASSGNDGREGNTYPAAFPTVLAVGASDRNNERAQFSQYGDFVDVAAPGVDMLSTVPKGGQCVDNGTSFSAPYVAGVAALLKAKYPGWKAAQIRARIEQTAQRNERGRNRFIGWGVVDPVKALTVGGEVQAPTASANPTVKLDAAPIQAQPLGLAETQEDRNRRTGTLVLGGGVLAVAALAGGSVVLRDYRRRGRH